MPKEKFIKNFLLDYKIAAFSRSSKFLVNKVSQGLSHNLNIIMEQGAGDGAMTMALLRKLSPTGKLILIEQNQEFIEQLRKIHDTRIIIFEGLIQDFDYKKYLLPGEKVDLVISSIPFSFLSKKEKEILCKNVYENLTPNGTFIIFHQYNTNVKNVLSNYFNNIKISFVARNVFPCFIISTKK